MSIYAPAFMELFKGMEEAYGEYAIADKPADPETKKKQGQAVTIREPVTEVLWVRHLAGRKTLGIIPINSLSMCQWGAIDIDNYDLDIVSFSKAFYKRDLPLIPFRSKSGGCHLILFLTEPVPAKELQAKLSEIAACLGYGTSEIFPKQTKVLIDKGDLGNWLNMPYFGGEKSTRYALDKKGEALPVDKFLDFVKDFRITPKQLKTIKVLETGNILPDGPPCLQALVQQGFPQGTRNNGLFALGVYCRKAFPDNWEREIEAKNTECMDPPLDSKEVQLIVKQIGKKDYNYKCSDQPLAAFCNSALCRTRKYGIGGGAMPTMTGLRKLPTDQPVWFLEVNTATLELNTDQLQKQTLFQKACMEAINYMPPKIGERQWQTLIQVLLDNCVELDKPKEAGIGDQFNELFVTFCTDSRLRANAKEELLLGRPWVGPDPNDESSFRIYFRLRDIEEFLVRNGFKYYTRSQIISKLTSKEMGCHSHFFKIKGKGVNVWYVEEFENMNESFELPDMGGDVL